MEKVKLLKVSLKPIKSGEAEIQVFMPISSIIALVPTIGDDYRVVINQPTSKVLDSYDLNNVWVKLPKDHILFHN